ncbi:ribosome biogenesis factor YjgA [Jeongeupia naejangsanensis]|uniref:Dual-action ribosomal maturation protein DarP n=1 Tax=Jeongeupia naejangsanensis TaxID=613195 RepID=A0ABS2BIU6_9NEIS|nr:ribosome biogenesis factor YjgA [Jeongeupia naejangsanensis]MBM3115527.1 DUF615 domain-containing protein [Jeongeupia naejangsanensis]
MARHQDPLPHDDDVEIVSKSQMKRDMNALQDLGEALIPLDRKHLIGLGLPETLFNALIEAKRLTAHGAVARHKQYIGKLMRQVDPAPIQALLDSLAGNSDRHNAWLHQLERQRDKLLADPKSVEALINDHPGLDVQQLRQLIRNALKEREQQKPPKAFRELFQLLKTLYPEPPLIDPREER